MTKKEESILLLELQAMHESQNDMATDVRLIKVKLYGENGFKGDIPEIKALMAWIEKRVSKNSRYIYVVLGLLGASGAGYGISFLG